MKIIEKAKSNRIPVVDDELDITLTLQMCLESYLYHDNARRRFEVHLYKSSNLLSQFKPNFYDLLLTESQFKPNFYDLLLTDIYMPQINEFELCQKIMESDPNIRVCLCPLLK